MTLEEFIRSHPHRDRVAVKNRLGAACNVSEYSIRSWAIGHRRPAAKRVRPLCEATGWKVTPGEVLPEVFGSPQA